MYIVKHTYIHIYVCVYIQLTYALLIAAQTKETKLKGSPASYCIDTDRWVLGFSFTVTFFIFFILYFQYYLPRRLKGRTRTATLILSLDIL